MARDPVDADVAHAHTWYADMAGLLVRLLHRVPLVVTLHSLEPLRPWKADQLGTGYLVSSWVEKTVVEAADRIIAVSEGMREDIQQHFRIDPARVVGGPQRHRSRALSPRPGRATPSRGWGFARPMCSSWVASPSRRASSTSLEAAAALPPERPGGAVRLGARHAGDRGTAAPGRGRPARPSGGSRRCCRSPDVIQLYSHAAVFCCPSVYEPFGIINLEAMACETPVVASAVGGILEVVEDGATGLLVPPHRPADLAAALNALLDDPARARAMGQAGRKRVEEHFSWASVAGARRPSTPRPSRPSAARRAMRS